MTQLPFAALLLTVIYISSAFAAKPEAVSESESGIAIVGAGLIDGTGTAVVADSIILIQGDRITAVGSRDRVDIPDSATIVDATGKFVMPGLIDLHNHYGGGRAELERLFSLQLDFGVTTARSLGADGAENLQVIAEAKAGKIEAPRLYTAGTGFSHKDGMPPGAAIQRPTSAATGCGRGRLDQDVGRSNVGWAAHLVLRLEPRPRAYSENQRGDPHCARRRSHQTRYSSGCSHLHRSGRAPTKLGRCA